MSHHASRADNARVAALSRKASSFGMVRQGLAGEARRGETRPGLAQHGEARQAWRGEARPGGVWLCEARHGRQQGRLFGAALCFVRVSPVANIETPR